MIGLAYIQGFDDPFGTAPHEGCDPNGTRRLHAARAAYREIGTNASARTPINRNTGTSGPRVITNTAPSQAATSPLIAALWRSA